VRERTRQLQEKNHQMQEELQMARELQLALLPRKFPRVPSDAPADESALRFLSLYFPTGDVSGDFFSIFPVGKKAAGVFNCDVMSHGVRSALITSMIRGLIHEPGQSAPDPGQLLTEVNRALTDILRQAETTMFATCFYLVADVENARLQYASAGHPSALRLRPAEAVREQMGGVRGLAAGIFPEARYQTASCGMNKGDRIILFTDGLFEVESASGDLFSEEQLRATATQHAVLASDEFFHRVVADVRQFAQRESFEDDVCLVGIEVRHTAASVGEEAIR
jgi:sigma-B regulation protein RsbU (phosphoserine phosphatase)